MSITLVAALGNPGREYASNRHNYGWIVLDALARKRGLAWKQAPQFNAEVARWNLAGGGTRWLVKPQTFMNESGRAIGAVARYYKLDVPQVVAIYDDLTIDLGLIKVSVSGSAGGHNGVASLLEHLGDGFIRYRLGIGPKSAAMELTDFVLGNFTTEQHTFLTQQLETHVSGLELLLSRGVETAMNQLNRRDAK